MSLEELERIAWNVGPSVQMKAGNGAGSGISATGQKDLTDQVADQVSLLTLFHNLNRARREICKKQLVKPRGNPDLVSSSPMSTGLETPADWGIPPRVPPNQPLRAAQAHARTTILVESHALHSPPQSLVTSQTYDAPVIPTASRSNQSNHLTWTRGTPIIPDLEAGVTKMSAEKEKLMVFVAVDDAPVGSTGSKRIPMPRGVGRAKRLRGEGAAEPVETGVSTPGQWISSSGHLRRVSRRTE